MDEELKKYARLKSALADLEMQVELQRRIVLKEVISIGGKAKIAGVGSFSIRRLPFYTYSPAVRELKKVERDNGIAVYNETEALYFNPEK